MNNHFLSLTHFHPLWLSYVADTTTLTSAKRGDRLVGLCDHYTLRTDLTDHHSSYFTYTTDSTQQHPRSPFSHPSFSHSHFDTREKDYQHLSLKGVIEDLFNLECQVRPIAVGALHPPTTHHHGRQHTPLTTGARLEQL